MKISTHKALKNTPKNPSQTILNHLNGGASSVKVNGTLQSLIFRDMWGQLQVHGGNNWESIEENEIDGCLDGLRGEIEVIGVYPQ